MAVPAAAADLPESLSLHGQFTGVVQYHPAFTSPFAGANSLDGSGQTRETIDATLFLGARLTDGLEVYVNPEVDQGFGLSDTLGLAGFSSGEAYKVGSKTPYLRLQRAFVRYTIGLGGDPQKVEGAANQVAGARDADNLILTAGKLSAGDIFDTNTYAHDPRGDFLNWAMIDSGAYDYAADAWGYTYGVAAEWTEGWWTWRLGLFDLSDVPNSTTLETDFSQFEAVTELEARHDLFAQPGKIKLLAYANRGRMGAYTDAVALQGTNTVPDTSLVRRTHTRAGMALNLEQGLSEDLGMFARASLDDGRQEAYEFTEINRSLTVGFSLKGASWGRANDTLGVAGVVNGISRQAQAYFAAGGLGILIGDGKLPRAGTEDILESYYRAGLASDVSLSLDYQFALHPAYDAARGPVHILGLRLHAEF